MCGLVSLVALLPALTPATAGATTGCTTTWKSPGTSGLFLVPANWTNGAPSAAKDACLPQSTTPYTVTERGPASLHRLSVGSGATLHMESTTAGTVTLAVGRGGVANSGTIELVNKDTQPRATALSVDNAPLENAGTIRVLPSGTSVPAINATLHNTASGTLDVGNTAFVATVDNDGFVNVAQFMTLSTFTLTNYNATTHTLTGGVFNVAGTLSVPFIDVKTLDAELSIVGEGNVFEPTRAVFGLGNLTTVAADGSLFLTNGASIAIPPLTNHGRVSIDTGSLLLTTGDYTEAGVFTSLATGGRLVANHATVKVTSGAIVGSGTILSPVVNSGGTLYPAGPLTIQANYTQTAAGTLSTRVGGASGGNTLLVPGGIATLAGTLAVSAESSLSPRVGMSFPVVQAGARVGTFTKVVSDGLVAPLRFRAAPGGASVAASVVAAYNDDNSYVAYAGWRGGADKAASGGTFRYTCDAGQSATFAFTGSVITWDTVRGTQMGKAQVLIDGVNKGTFDFYAANNGLLAERFGGLSATKHTLTVRALGAKNANATDSCVIVDGLRVGTAVTNDTARTIAWSGWTGVTAGGDGYHSANAAGRKVELAVYTPSGVDWVTRTGPDQGTAQISVGGTVVKTVNLYSPTVHTGVVVPIDTATGFNTVGITVFGAKDPASTGTTVTIDSLVAR